MVLLGVVFYGLLAVAHFGCAGGALVMLLNVIGLLEFYGMVKENQLFVARPHRWSGAARRGVSFSGLAAKWFGLAAPSLTGAAELEAAILAVS